MRAHFTVLSVLLLAVVLGGCRARSIKVAPPVRGDGVKVELVFAKHKKNRLDVRLIAYSELDRDIEVNRNHIAVVLPDGSEFYRTGSRPVQTLKPRGRQVIGLSYVLPTYVNFKRLPGAYLRFDGFYADYDRLNVPAMALGHPQHSPGYASDSLQSPLAERNDPNGQRTSRQGALRQVVDRVKGSNDAPAQSGGGIQYFKGPRRRIQAQGTRCAAMPMSIADVSDNMSAILDDLLLSELQNVGFEAIGPDDVNAMLGFEKLRDSLGCDDVACGVEIGHALGVDHLVSGNIAVLDGGTAVTLKIIDVRNTRVLSRANRIDRGDERVLPRLIAEVVQDLVARAEL